MSTAQYLPTPFQKEWLAAIGRSALAKNLVWSGGTALNAVYGAFRLSEDLDFL